MVHDINLRCQVKVSSGPPGEQFRKTKIHLDRDLIKFLILTQWQFVNDAATLLFVRPETPQQLKTKRILPNLQPFAVVCKLILMALKCRCHAKPLNYPGFKSIKSNQKFSL